MREPITKFPKRPNSPDHVRRTITECETMLANPRLSPEMREALESRVMQLRLDLKLEAAERARRDAPPAEESDLPRRSWTTE